MKKIRNMELTPLTKSLSEEYVFVDNELQESLNRLRFWHYFSRYGISSKRFGYPLKQIVFTLLIWAFLNKDSIRSFLRNLVSSFFRGGKDVLYDFLKREDINWRNVSLSLAKEVYTNRKLCFEKESAFVVDDTIKKRRGRKVEAEK